MRAGAIRAVPRTAARGYQVTGKIVIEVTSKGVEAFGDMIPGQNIELRLPGKCYRITRYGVSPTVCKEDK